MAPRTAIVGGHAPTAPTVAPPIEVGSWNILLRPSWLATITVTLAVVAAVTTTGFRVIVATGDGRSMEPTLCDGGREILFARRGIVPVEGGIYAFKDPTGTLCIKRAAKIQGDKVWFLGDNQGLDRDDRPESEDSREYGWVACESIVATHAMTLPALFNGPTSAEVAAVGSPNAPTQKDRDKAKDAWLERAVKRQAWVAANHLTPVLTTTKRSDKDGTVEHVVSLDHQRSVWSARFVLDIGAEGTLTVEVSPDRKVWEKVEIKDGDQIKWGGVNTKEALLPFPRKVTAICFRVEHPDVPVDLKYTEVLVQKS